MMPDDWLVDEKGLVLFRWGKWGNWEEMAQRLFEGLRWLERQKVSVIVAPLPPPIGLGLAIRDRLTKAASTNSATNCQGNSR
jgi:L-threonylcarbamoyladenylate synthase